MANASPQFSEWNSETLREFPPSERYLIGVSGGRDSIALLHWLTSRGYARLIVCHLDHRLRGRASAADALFVKRIAASLNLSFIGSAADVPALARRSKISLETAARFARYEFFAAAARRRRCPRIFLGHHANDLVESFLLNLFRGTGGAGSRSIQSVSRQTIGPTELVVIRPLLHLWRREIDDFISARKLKFREDATNESLAATRNRIRHKVIPYLEHQFGRAIRETVWRTAKIAAEESAFIEQSIPENLRRLEALPVKEMLNLSVALQRRVLRSWLRQHAVTNIGFDLIERARALLDPSKGAAKINLARDRHARRRSGKLFIE